MTDQRMADGVEGALWMALRAVGDRDALSHRPVERSESGDRRISAARYRDELEGMAHSIEIMRRLFTAPRAKVDPRPEPPAPGNQADA